MIERKTDPSPMEYLISLTYDKVLIRQAVLAFWWRSLGIGYVAALLVVAVMLAALLNQGSRSWQVGVLVSVLVFGVGMALAVFVVHYGNSIRKFKQMGSPHAQFHVSESTFTLTSAIGSSTLAWSTVSELWRFKHFWLLLFSSAQFVTLPLADISPETRALIIERVRVAGGKIA